MHKVKALIISPHPDDAALSLGPIILAKHFACEVVTVFNKVTKDYAHLLELRPELIAPTRMKEDRQFAKAINAGIVFLHEVDACNRGYADTELFSGRFREKGLLTRLTRKFVRLFDRRRPDIVMVPAAIGGHVDHAVVLRAGISLAIARPAEYYIYEDIPYALGKSQQAIKIELSEKVMEISGGSCAVSPIAVRLGRKAVLEGGELLSFYRSQLSEDLRNAIRTYYSSAERPYTSRIWKINVRGTKATGSVFK